MSNVPKENIHDQRRASRVPYDALAQIEIVGVTGAGGWTLRIVDINEWGLGFLSSRQIPLVAAVLHLPAWDGYQVVVNGWTVHCFNVGDQWGGGIEFDAMQPRLRPFRITSSNTHPH